MEDNVQTCKRYLERMSAMGMTLEIELGGQKRMIAQSMAILELLEELHPTPALLPKDAYLRARTRELAEAVNAGIIDAPDYYENRAHYCRSKWIGAGRGACDRVPLRRKGKSRFPCRRPHRRRWSGGRHR